MTLWVNRYRSLRTENCSMSAVSRKRRKVTALASVAKRYAVVAVSPLQRPAPCYRRMGQIFSDQAMTLAAIDRVRSIAWAALAFERGFPAIALDVHLQESSHGAAAIVLR
jgi:hypothetical protein